MRLNLRYAGIALGVIAVLLVAPTICAASMDMADMSQHSGSHQEGTAIPEHVSISASPLSHHVLMNTIGEQVTANRLVPNEVFCLALSPADPTIEPSPTEGQPVQTDVRDHAPPKKPIEYHCRNFLSSEEPPL